jgi:hypothetical protein
MRFRPPLILILLALAPVSRGQSNLCEDGVLPSKAKQLLDQRFRDWRPKYTSDLSAHDKKLWLETHPKECPGIAVGHFEQPDRAAYAILLVPKSAHTASYKIIVLSDMAGEYAMRLLDQAEGSTYSDSGLIISKETHGRFSDFGNTKSVRLKLDGVNVEWIEKGSVLYYWSRGSYRSLQTSD